MNTESIIFRELPVGTTLAQGKYLIEKVLGVGGFGITYKARHATLNQHYAIKEFFISGHCVRNTQHKTVHLHGMQENMYDQYKQKFVEEAQTLVKLDHPNIVRVLDIFEENGTFYIVMPFVHGETLQSIVEREGKLPYEIGVNYIAQVCEALDYVHARNLLHRDVKPDNIMITPEEKAVLIDFGSAREFVHDEMQTHTTILTQGYAPLEQYSKLSRKGAYTDIYGIGAVFYFLVTGQKPMDATDRIEHELENPIAFVPDLPDNVNKTIIKAMALKPENRYQDVDEFMCELTECKDWRRPAGATIIGMSKKLVIGIVIGLVILFAGAGVWYYLYNQDQKKKDEIIRAINRDKNIEKRAMLGGTVDSLRVCLYGGKVYLRPTSTKSKLDTTVWYVPGDSALIVNNPATGVNNPLPVDSLIKTIAALPDDLERAFEMDYIPPECSYFLYTGRMNIGFPNDTDGKAIYDCGNDKFSYKGIFMKGLREGKGLRIYSDGEMFKNMTFDGYYIDDKPDHGTLKYKDYDNNEYVEKGTWEDGSLYNGTITKNGTPIIKFENGQRIKL